MLFEPGTNVRVKAGAVAIIYTLVETHEVGYYPDSRIEVGINEIEEDFDGIVMVVKTPQDLRRPDNTTIVLDVATGVKHVFTDNVLKSHIEERDA